MFTYLIFLRPNDGNDTNLNNDGDDVDNDNDDDGSDFFLT